MKREALAVFGTAGLLLAGFLQGWQFGSIVGPESAGGIKVLHLVVLAVVLTTWRKVIIPEELRALASYLCFIVLASLVAYFWFPPSPLVLNYVFCLVVIAFVGGLSRRWAVDDRLTGARAAFWVLGGAVALNMITNWALVQVARAMPVNSGARAVINSPFISGGPNVEGTWVALGAAMFLQRPRQFVVYSAISLFVQVGYMTRTGVLVWAFLVGLFLFLRLRRLFGPAALLAVVAGSGAAAWAALNRLAETVPVVARFASIGNEPGSRAREQIWSKAIESVWRAPLEFVGAGNEMSRVRALGYLGPEDNPHNLILTNALAFGILGAIFWIAIMWHLIRVSINRPEVAALVGAFFLASMFEFRGADSIFYLAVALLVPGLANGKTIDATRSKHRATHG